jgi:molybdate/tungstate transport system substrate-binding protein
MDYAFEYLSVAIQHELDYVTFDDPINLGNYKYDGFYKTAEVKVTGKEPGTWITKKGKSCTYGVTLIKDAPNREAAVAFLEYLLSPDHGLEVLEEMGQPPFIPCRIPSEDMAGKLPAELKSLVEVRD